MANERRWYGRAATLAIVVLLPASATAGEESAAKGREGPLAPSALAAGNAADVAEARRFYQRATAHYNLQEYKEAIADFQQGYRLHPDSVFLYDIAQAHRLLGAYERALFFYRAYLRADPEAVNREEVRTRIQDLEAAVAASRRPPDNTLGPAPDPAPKSDPPSDAHVQLVAPVAPPPKRTPFYKTWWFWTAGGVVVAGAVVGIAVAARPKHDEVLTPVNLGGN